jgi:hypothetical protein
VEVEVDDGERVGVAEGVEVIVGAEDGVEVWDGRLVEVDVDDGETVGVAEGVEVVVGVGDGVEVDVSEGVEVSVGVDDDVAVGEGDGLGVDVNVGSFVAVGVNVSSGSGVPAGHTCGEAICARPLKYQNGFKTKNKARSTSGPVSSSALFMLSFYQIRRV